jgi:hypothetical protein
MPDRPESTPPPPSPSPEETAFRHTFLYRFEDAQAEPSLGYLGQILADYLDETGQWGDTSAPSVTHGKLRAVAADLREIEAFLDQLNRAKVATTLELQEERLATLAAKWRRKLGKLASSIEREVCE